MCGWIRRWALKYCEVSPLSTYNGLLQSVAGARWLDIALLDLVSPIAYYARSGKAY
jgi:hypothetical protein